MSLTSWPKRLLILLGIVCFIGSGLIINAIQFFLLPVYLLKKQLFRLINIKLVYLHWAIIPWTIQTWAQYDIRLFTQSSADIDKYANREHALCILNHRGDMDWAIGWCINDRIGMLTTAKAIMKDIAKWVPGIGWMFAVMEFPFLKRDWKNDESRLAAACQNLADYPKNMLLALFAEGTRFTDEKYRVSVEYAKQHDLPVLKHHLLPRKKGFSLLVKHLKHIIPAVYDITLVCREGTPTLKSMINRDYCAFDVIIRRFPMSEIPSDNEQLLANWLFKLYQEKDELYDYHVEHKSFPPEYQRVNLPKTIWPDVVMGFWFLVLGIPSVWVLLYLFWIRAWLSLLIIITIIILFNQLFAVLVNLTEVEKGSRHGLKPVSAHSGIVKQKDE